MINSGVAFGWWSGFEWSVLIGVLMVGIFYKFKWSWWLGGLLTGSLSNWIDRLRAGGVIDYWNFFGLFFNLADLLIVVSAMGLIYSEVYGAKDTV